VEELLGSVRGRFLRCLYGAPALSSHRVIQQDRAVLVAAIAVGATHLLTGYFRHFGPYYGKRTEGFSFCRRENISLPNPNSPRPQEL